MTTREVCRLRGNALLALWIVPSLAGYAQELGANVLQNGDFESGGLFDSALGAGWWGSSETPSADGYAPGTAPADCMPHDSYYAPQDWAIALGELLRATQFFNAHGYAFCPDAGTEDGFCLSPSP